MIAGRHFLQVAEVLAPYEGEAFMRTRIGRLYYAVYLEARDYAERHLGHSRLKLAREHQAIAHALARVDPELEFRLRDLRSTRNAADYDDQLSHDHIMDLLDRAIETSTWIMARLDDLNRHP
jgi:hypothetical protein